MPGSVVRLIAGLCALVALTGLAIQFQASLGMTGSAAGAAWAMLRYFTVLANILFGVAMVGVAVRGAERVSAVFLGGVTLAMLLVGAVYGLLLNGLLELSGGALLADVIMHKVTPVLALLFWVLCAPKGRFRRIDPWLWSVFPLAYLVYALARAAADGSMPIRSSTPPSSVGRRPGSMRC
jgi:hypothetical protein